MILCRALACLVALTFVCEVRADSLTDLASGRLAGAQAANAAKELQSDPDLELLEVLQSMKDASLVNKNWLLAVAQSVADRDRSTAREDLEQFLPRLSEDSSARYWAFHFLTRDDQALREQLLSSMLADPCLELRYEAVALAMKQVEADKSLDKNARLSAYNSLLNAARLPEQVQAIAEELGELGTEVDLLTHFGFLTKWQAVGPFDNVDGIGFGHVYAPETAYSKGELDTKQTYKGKGGEVGWLPVSTESKDGAVNLSEVLKKEKGAVAYVAGEFQCGDDMDCELRIGSPNATVVWLNGKKVIEREVYHSGSQIDQYVAPVQLREGKNTLLIKSCQNEQTEPWAQDWSFQLRFTDATGFAIQPAE